MTSSIPTDEGAAGPVQAAPVAWIDKTSLAELLANRATYAHVVHKCRTIEGDTPLYIGQPPQPVKPAMQHTGECATDDISRQVCEDIYRERCDDNLALCEALRAVYALYGEDKQVKKIVHDAIKAHGIDHE